MAIRSIFPEVSVVGDINVQIQEDPVVVSLDKSFKLDTSFGDLEVAGGNIVFVTELDNLTQWISKTLTVALGYYEIYNVSYGNQILNLIATGESPDLIEMLFSQFIHEALKNDDRIISMDRFVITRTGFEITASFRIQSINFDLFTSVTSVVII